MAANTSTHAASSQSSKAGHGDHMVNKGQDSVTAEGSGKKVTDIDIRYLNKLSCHQVKPYEALQSAVSDGRSQAPEANLSSSDLSPNERLI